SPTGAVTGLNDSYVAYDAGPFTLTEAGTYTLRISGSGAATGAYSFRLLDVAAQPALSLNAPVTGTLGPGTRTDLYRLSGTAGQRLYFTWQGGTDYYGSYTLYGPGNQQIGSTYFGNLLDVTLPLDGPYALALAGGNGSATVAYDFRVATPPVTTPALTLGTTVSGTLAAAGQTDNYTFTGAAGQRLYFDGLSSAGMYATLTSPTGAVTGLNDSYVAYDAGPFTLTEAGTCTLRISGSGA